MAGADIDATTNDGVTPLIEAARHGAIDTLKLLLDRSAKINVTDKAGLTALDYAIAKKQDWPVPVDTLIAKGAKTAAQLKARP